MNNRLCITLLCVFALGIGSAAAKVRWLPDYLFGMDNRKSQDDSYKEMSHTYSCPDGWKSRAQIGGLVCETIKSFKGVGDCYTDCYDKCERYESTVAKCNGFDCKTEVYDCPGKCEECYTDNCHKKKDKEDCTYGCKGDEEVEGCLGKCEECKELEEYCDAFELIENCAYGCEIEEEACDGRCKQCYTDNCRNRGDNSTDYGCDKNWDDCPEKCEQGKVCTPNDCSDYTLDTIPANASYEECEVGCGNQTKRYRFISCDSGYFDMDSFVCSVSGSTASQLCTWTIQ